MKKNINRIAIVRLSAIGDIIHSAVVLQFIKKYHPHAKIEWICEEAFAPLLKNHPHIDKIHTINLKQLKKQKNIKLLMQNISKLRHLGHFDIVIDMQGLLKSAIVSRLVSPNTHGFDKHSTRESIASFFYKTTSNIAYEENIVKRNCFLVGNALGFGIDDKEIDEKEIIFDCSKSLHAKMLKNDKKNIAIIIGASWQSKKYPKEKIIKICDRFKQNCIIIWGSDEEKKEATWICKNSSFATLAPKMDLKELCSFISEIDLVIGNDTGPTHIAWAQNIPSIVLFGPTNERMMWRSDKNIAINSPSSVDINHIDKNDFSIKDIKVDEIIKNAERLL